MLILSIILILNSLAISLFIYYNAEMNKSKIKHLLLCLTLIASFSVGALAQETEPETSLPLYSSLLTY